MSNGALGEANTATSATSSRLETLKSWLDANNVRLSSKLAIRAVPSNAESAATNDIGHEHSYGIFARENIQQDEILAVIPRSAILSKRTCAMADDPVFVEFCDRVYYTTPLQAGVRILATVLMLEILSGSASRWYGYIESMPQSYEKVGLPVFWEDQKALHWLQNTDVQAYMEGQRCTKVSDKVKIQFCSTLLNIDIEGRPEILSRLCSAFPRGTPQGKA